MTDKEALDDYKDFGKIKGESITSNQTFTSNEALRILSECANGEKKLLFSDSLDLEQIISKRLEKLEKLERAFKILINHGFKIGRNIGMEVDFGIAFKNCVITGQEYEMIYEALEELMKDDK